MGFFEEGGESVTGSKRNGRGHLACTFGSRVGIGDERVQKVGKSMESFHHGCPGASRIRRVPVGNMERRGIICRAERMLNRSAGFQTVREL